MFAELSALKNMMKPQNLEEYLSNVSIYQKQFELEEDKTMRWYVQDSRLGYLIFKDEHLEDRKNMPIFVKWIFDKNEAIEFCYELSKKEIDKLKAKV